jgi:membrane dipeptidase
MASDPRIIVDAHEDIAYNTLNFGRNFINSVYRTRQLEANQPISQGTATVGLPEAILGRVAIMFGTLFASPAAHKMGDEVTYYETPAQAYKQGIAQIDVYQRLAESEEANGRIQLIRTQGELASVLATWAEGTNYEDHKLGLVILMEGADPILEPKQFEEWYERGVRIVGPAWGATRYSGGTGEPGPLTSLGRDLLEVLASFNAVLDVSHLSEEAFFEAVERYEGIIIASHTNARHFRDSDRHLSDDMIRRLADRDGVIGAVAFNAFLQNGWAKTDPKFKTPLDRYIAAIDHVCQVTGSARHAGIGTDFDGGFGAEHIPAEIDTVADLHSIGPRLATYGYSEPDITAILGGNFLRILRAALPK